MKQDQVRHAIPNSVIDHDGTATSADDNLSKRIIVHAVHSRLFTSPLRQLGGGNVREPSNERLRCNAEDIRRGRRTGSEVSVRAGADSAERTLARWPVPTDVHPSPSLSRPANRHRERLTPLRRLAVDLLLTNPAFRESSSSETAW